MAEQNLMIVPERELQRACQMWLNQIARMRATFYQYGVGDTSLASKQLDELREASRPLEKELARRARLVLK